VPWQFGLLGPARRPRWGLEIYPKINIEKIFIFHFLFRNLNIEKLKSKNLKL